MDELERFIIFLKNRSKNFRNKDLCYLNLSWEGVESIIKAYDNLNSDVDNALSVILANANDSQKREIIEELEASLEY